MAVFKQVQVYGENQSPQMVLFIPLSGSVHKALVRLALGYFIGHQFLPAHLSLCLDLHHVGYATVRSDQWLSQLSSLVPIIGSQSARK